MSKRNKKNTSNKRQKLVTVTIKDWLKLKPYDTASNHDMKYLLLSQEIYKTLAKSFYQPFKTWGYERKNLAQLSVILASYVEDFASEIGIWKAFTDYNKEQFGVPLPLFDIKNEEYFENDLNPQDLSYIVWHYTSNQLSDGIFPPYRFTDIGDAIYDLLEPQIEDLSVTNYYDKFLTIADNENFFDLKTKLTWFGLNSYLIGIDFGKKHGEIASKVMKHVEGLIQKKGRYDNDTEKLIKYADMMVYTAMNDFIYYDNSKYAGLNTPIWFSKIIRASEAAKSKIADFYKYRETYFEFVRNEKKCYIFEAILTGRKFEVAKDSFEPDFLKNTPVGSRMEMAIFYWNQYWYMSGGIVGFADNKLEMKKNKPIPYFAYPEEVKPNVFGMIKEMRDIFIDLYGTPLVLCKNGTELQSVLNRFYDAQYEKMVKKEDRDEKRKPIENNLGDVERENPSVFFHSTKGIIIMDDVQELIDLLNKEEGSLTEDEIDTVFDWFHISFDTEEFVEHILENFPTHNIQAPRWLHLDIKQDSGFLRRFFHPEDYEHTPFPNNSIVDSDKFENW